MDTKDYLAYVVRQIHTTIVATVDDDGLPVTAAIDMMDSDDDSPRKYFIKINPMCKNCSKLYNGCNGTANLVWTGCVDRKLKEVTA